MGEVDAIVEDGRFAEDHVLGADAVSLLGIFAPVEPDKVTDGRAVGKVRHNSLLALSHREGFEAEDMPHDLYIRHVARQFMDGVDL